MRNRKAQGLSLNVIIIAAIALVVLVVLITLVLNSGGKINQGVNACSSNRNGVEGSDWACVAPDSQCPNGMNRSIILGCSGRDFGEQTKCCTPPLV